mmetsp:Transcript_68894/g.138519  ORF Transcript_68894/g.138519 Transcript_68894/m.138519 type:complete len:204 (-) Transcript_68894:45-656(-)
MSFPCASTAPCSAFADKFRYPYRKSKAAVFPTSANTSWLQLPGFCFKCTTTISMSQNTFSKQSFSLSSTCFHHHANSVCKKSVFEFARRRRTMSYRSTWLRGASTVRGAGAEAAAASVIDRPKDLRLPRIPRATPIPTFPLDVSNPAPVRGGGGFHAAGWLLGAEEGFFVRDPKMFIMIERIQNVSHDQGPVPLLYFSHQLSF